MENEQLGTSCLPYLRNNIKRLKKETAIKTISQLAQATGLSENTIKSICRKNNTSRPSIRTLEKIATAFGVTYEALISTHSSEIIEDQRLGKIIQKEEQLQNIIKTSLPHKQFEAALIENGFDDILAFINYLLFLGYEVFFYSIGVKPDYNKSDMLLKSYRKQNSISKQNTKIMKDTLAGMEAEIVILKNKLASLSCADDEYGDIVNQIDDLNIKAQELTIEIQSLAELEMGLNEKISEHNFKQEIGIPQIIKIFQKIASLHEQEFMSRLKSLPLYVKISSVKMPEVKQLSFYDFYSICLNFNERIEHKLNSL